VVITAVEAVGRGGGTAVRDSPGGASLGTSWVSASVSRVSMMKHTVGASGVFLGSSGRGVSNGIAVGTLGIVVSLCRFLNLEAF